MPVLYGSPGCCGIVKIHFWSTEGERHPNWTYLNHNNSARNCSISPKFDTGFDHITINTIQTFKVKTYGSKVKVTL